MTSEDKIFKKRRWAFKPKKTLSQEANKVITALIITLAVFVVALGTILVITSSKSSQQGYLLKQAQIENDKLRVESEELKTKIVKVQSFQEIQESDKVSGMEEVSEKEYVVPGE